MSEYVIYTDSSCDLPAWKLAEIGVEVVPLVVDLDGHSFPCYPDWRNMDAGAFYQALRSGAMAKTAAANADSLETAFRKELAAGMDVLCIAFSSGMSSTFNCARLASEALRTEFPERRVRVVDSLSASLGQGLLVVKATIQKAEGASMEEVAVFCERMRGRIAHWFTVDDLHFLHRGGRISKSTAVIGSTLGMKPFLYCSAEGRLEKHSVVRGRKAALKKLGEMTEKWITDRQMVYISHGDCADEAAWLADWIKKNVNAGEILVNHVDPVIGAHSGPGTIAVFFETEHR